jgi:porin
MGSLMVLAAEPDTLRHGAIPATVETAEISAGTTMTLQHASDSRLDDELLASVDIVSAIPTRNGQWLLYVEGNTSPRQQGISSLLPEANQDAATAVDRDGHGRLQVSVLHYLWYLGQNALVVGLINPAGPIDNSDIANNETSQFLATTLVINPTIAHPDYALGMVYFYKPEHSKLDFTFLLSSSHGLTDNPNRSYAELVDVTAAGKGVFACAELVWRGAQHTWRSGVWVQTAGNAYLNGSANTADNYGVYLNSDHLLGQFRLNLRLGLANPKLSEAAQFIGLAMDHALGKNHAGLGYTYTFVSDEVGAGKGDRIQLEAYYRVDLADNLSITPSLQHIRNSGFDNTGTTIDSGINVISVRTSYAF